jgi:FAD-dependent urate hydroxylase
MRGEDFRVLVVGAGIAGLAAARVMRNRGATVTVVERSPAAIADGFGIYLPGNATRALRQLGLDRAVASRAVRIERQEVADHRGRLLFDVDLAEVWGEVGPCLALPRADLHQALLAGADGVEIRWGCAPREIAPAAHRARVVLSDGTSDAYDLVLGADGVHSTVRRLVFGEPAARPVGQYARRFLAPWADPRPVWSAMLGHGSTFLTIPIGRGQVYCYCDGPLETPAPSLGHLLADYADPVPAVLEGLRARGGEAALHAGPVEEVVLESWSSGAVLLIGDAAHATSPNMAEGGAMALEDAIVLGESLTKAESVPEALGTYERRRRPRTSWVLAQTHRRDRTRGLLPVLRNLILRKLGRRIFHATYRPLRDTP